MDSEHLVFVEPGRVVDPRALERELAVRGIDLRWEPRYPDLPEEVVGDFRSPDSGRTVVRLSLEETGPEERDDLLASDTETLTPALRERLARADARCRIKTELAGPEDGERAAAALIDSIAAPDGVVWSVETGEFSSAADFGTADR